MSALALASCAVRSSKGFSVTTTKAEFGCE